MKKITFICLLLFLSCAEQKNDNVQGFNDKKENIKIKDSVVLNSSEKIMSFSHLKNDIKDGYSIIFNEGTKMPKYLVEYNKGKRNGLIIEFYDDGKMKSIRTSDINNDSQQMRFYQNGVIKEIGNTVKGSSNGEHYYFDVEGKLIKKTLYGKGKILSE